MKDYEINDKVNDKDLKTKQMTCVQELMPIVTADKHNSLSFLLND